MPFSYLLSADCEILPFILHNTYRRGSEIYEQTAKKTAELANLTQTIDAVTEAQNQPIPKKKKDVEREITALHTKNALQDREIEIRGHDQDCLYKELQAEKQRADRNERSTTILLKLEKYALEELAHAQHVANERKSQGGNSSALSTNRNQWTK